MAKSEYIGMITCPLCGSESATVHEQRTGSKKGRRYYRCYSEIGGMSMRCGTIQCIGPTGQTFINANMRPIAGAASAPPPIGQSAGESVAGASAPHEQSGAPIGQSAGDPPPKAPEPQPGPQLERKGLLDFLLGADDDE